MIEEALRKELLAARVELQQRACRTVRATPDHSVSTFIYFHCLFSSVNKLQS